MTFQGGHFFVEDFAVGPPTLALALIGLMALTILTSVGSLPYVFRNPLARRMPIRPPSVWRVLPLAIGLGGQFAIAPAMPHIPRDERGLIVFVLNVLAITGLALVGPWLCLVVSRGIARLSRRVPSLIAARRIAADPRATFRAVSGVALAAAAVMYLGSTVALFQPPTNSSAVLLRPGVVVVYTGGVPADQVAPLLTEQTVTVRDDGHGTVASCAELSRVRYNISCAALREDHGILEPVPGDPEPPLIVELYVPTDGSPAAENQVRTQAANLVYNAIINTDNDPVDHEGEKFFTDFGRFANIAALFVLIVGACNLVAGMLGGLIERRRPFALLRAAGMRVGELRLAVFLEAAGTMVLTALVGAGLGLISAYAASLQGGVVWTWPEPTAYVLVGSGVLAALAFSTFALPLIGLATRHDAVRYE